jgi:ornithine cyclodeaminase/alanine dehydrogenase-like protein (mu-crystallin family)
MNATATVPKTPAAPLLFDRDAVAEFLTLDTCILAVERAFAAHAEGCSLKPAMMHVEGDGGEFHIKAGLRGSRSYLACKVNGGFFQNPMTYARRPGKATSSSPAPRPRTHLPRHLHRRRRCRQSRQARNRTSSVVCDLAHQCIEVGDLHHAVRAGLLSSKLIRGELGEVISGTAPQRLTQDETIIFDSTGTALQDAAAAATVYERARAAGYTQSFSFWR